MPRNVSFLDPRIVGLWTVLQRVFDDRRPFGLPGGIKSTCRRTTSPWFSRAQALAVVEVPRELDYAVSPPPEALAELSQINHEYEMSKSAEAFDAISISTARPRSRSLWCPPVNLPAPKTFSADCRRSVYAITGLSDESPTEERHDLGAPIEIEKERADGAPLQECSVCVSSAASSSPLLSSVL